MLGNRVNYNFFSKKMGEDGAENSHIGQSLSTKVGSDASEGNIKIGNGGIFT